MNRGEASYQWLLDHPEFVEKHEGRWVVMDGSEVILVGDWNETRHVVVEKLHDPFITMLSTERCDGVMS